MVSKVVILASAMLAAVSGSPAYPSPAYSAPAYHAPAAYSAPAQYSFEYSVYDPYTYDVKSQHELSDGNGYVKGSYSLLEADGSTRIVEYTADDYDSFNAVVKNEGGYKAPSYSAPAYLAPTVYKAQ
uniref:Cuticle protein 8 n=1 Tax=Schizaphis graminum TaxID=13262 RepID=A0A2S2P1D1_SCHGA